MFKESELGTLIVVVLKARNLIDKHSFYKQDVFAQVSLNGNIKKTHVDVKGGQHPVWDSELRFPVLKTVSDKTRKIEVSCFAKEPRSDDLLGKGSVNIAETLQAGEFDDWVSLDIDGVIRGEIYLEMTYFSSSPTPLVSTSSSLAATQRTSLNRRPSKLPPSERLYRPPQLIPSQPVPTSDNHPPGLVYVERPFPLVSHPQPMIKVSAQSPPTKNGQPALPGSLKPGGSPITQAQGISTSSGAIPSILRPSNGNLPDTIPHQPNQTHRLSLSPPLNSGPFRPTSPSLGSSSYRVSSTPNPYLSTTPTPISSITSAPIPPSGITTTPCVNCTPYTTPVIPSSMPSNGDPTGTLDSKFSFPMPVIPSILRSDLPQTEPYDRYHHQATPELYSPLTPESYVPSTPSDSYLAARYQTPLPLPLETVAHAPSGPPRSRKPESQLGSDRLGVLKKAEEEAARRREQEQRDLELALRLDKELNT